MATLQREEKGGVLAHVENMSEEEEERRRRRRVARVKAGLSATSSSSSKVMVTPRTVMKRGTQGDFVRRQDKVSAASKKMMKIKEKKKKIQDLHQTPHKRHEFESEEMRRTRSMTTCSNAEEDADDVSSSSTPRRPLVIPERRDNEKVDAETTVAKEEGGAGTVFPSPNFIDLLLWKNATATGVVFGVGLLLFSGAFSSGGAREREALVAVLSSRASFPAMMQLLLAHVTFNAVRSVIGLPPWPAPHCERFSERLRLCLTAVARGIAAILSGVISVYVEASSGRGSAAATAAVCFWLAQLCAPMLPAQQNRTSFTLFLVAFSVPCAVRSVFGGPDRILSKVNALLDAYSSDWNPRKWHIAIAILGLMWLILGLPEKCVSLTLAVCLFDARRVDKARTPSSTNGGKEDRRKE